MRMFYKIMNTDHIVISGFVLLIVTGLVYKGAILLSEKDRSWKHEKTIIQ